MTSLGWLLESFLAMFFLIIAWLAIAFFGRNFQLKGEIILIWYMVGTIVGTAGFLIFKNKALAPLFPAPLIMAAIILVGLLIGAAANMLLFSAVTTAPNPALPTAISSSTSVGLFIISALLGVILPKYFGGVSFSWAQLVGILLVVGGVSCISLKV